MLVTDVTETFGPVTSHIQNAGPGRDAGRIDVATTGLPTARAATAQYGDGGNDHLSTWHYLSGDDVTSQNLIHGGAGSDTLSFQIDADGTDAQSSFADRIELNLAAYGETGHDKIRISALASGSADTSVNVHASGGAGADNVFLSVNISGQNARSFAEAYGGSSGDSILAYHHAAPQTTATLRLMGQSGNDALRIKAFGTGGTLDAALFGDGGSDNLVGEFDEGASLGARLNGGAHSDSLTTIGGPGADALTSGSGADVLLGGGGNDWLSPGSGNDSMTGGAGADTFVFDLFGAAGTNLITDFNHRVDKLQTGLSDQGAAGLADDIESRITLLDTGNEIHLSVLETGSVLILQDSLKRTITSLTDLMNDPFAQLL